MTIEAQEQLLIGKFIKRVPIFANFSDKRLEQIAGEFKFISVKNGEEIVFQTDQGTDLYIVLKGRVRVSLFGCEGNEFVLTSFREGDFFGEMSLIDGKSRSANVTAEEETLLGTLKREEFIETMKLEPAIALDLLSALVGRLRKADNMIETLAFLDVNDRLVRFLVKNAKICKENDGNDFLRLKKMTHQEIASCIGSSREAVSKALKVLALKEAVTEAEGHFIISPETNKGIDDCSS